MHTSFRQRSIRTIIVFSLTLAAALLTSLSVRAQTEAQVYLQPVTETADTVIVNIIAENVSDLYGVEIILDYDPATMSVRDANPDQAGTQIGAGDFLPGSQGFVIANQADQAQGTINFAMTLLNPAPAVNGSGTLASITFEPLDSAASRVEISSAKLVSSNLQLIPAQTAGITIGSSFPWWLVAAGILVMGLVGLGVLLTLRNGAANTGQSQHRLQTQPADIPQRSVPEHRRYRSGARPSAFKENSH